MARLSINKEKCKGCYLCVVACPKKILKAGSSSNNKGYYYIECTDDNACIGCAACANMCPDSAIEVD